MHQLSHLNTNNQVLRDTIHSHELEIKRLVDIIYTKEKALSVIISTLPKPQQAGINPSASPRMFEKELNDWQRNWGSANSYTCK